MEDEESGHHQEEESDVSYNPYLFISSDITLSYYFLMGMMIQFINDYRVGVVDLFRIFSNGFFYAVGLTLMVGIFCPKRIKRIMPIPIFIILVTKEFFI